MFRKSVAGIECHFLAAAWTFRNGSQHPYASTGYLSFGRDGLSGSSLRENMTNADEFWLSNPLAYNIC